MSLSNSRPNISLREYQGLDAYARRSACTISLASNKKSNLNTHYANVPLPTRLEQICLPHNPEYELFDHKGGHFISKCQEKLSFGDMCTQSLPAKFSYASLRKYLHPNFEGHEVTANEVVASQTRCRSTLAVPEYTAFQDLRLGCDVP